MLTVREAYLMGREHLAALGVAEPAIEAEVLLRRALHWDRTMLFTRWETPMDPEALSNYTRLLAARHTGRPIHYIIGEREFMGLTFTVDERVMIPRPETEVLVESLIDSFKTRAGQPVFIDVGTGSGCIAVSLAYALPQAEIYAIDISPQALEVAAANARRHGVGERIRLLEGDLLTPLPDRLRGQVDAIASNPPYVPPGQAPQLPREIKDFEPSVAVFSPGAGTGMHRRLAAAATQWLRTGGLLVMEVGAGQAEDVADALRTHGGYLDIRVLQDLAGIGRVVSANMR